MAPLRQHSASLTRATAALASARFAPDIDDSLHQRLESVVAEESHALSEEIEKLSQLIEAMQQQGERLVPLWSNDLWQSLNERLAERTIRIIPIGMPAWFKGDAPGLQDRKRAV